MDGVETCWSIGLVLGAARRLGDRDRHQADRARTRPAAAEPSSSTRLGRRPRPRTVTPDAIDRAISIIRTRTDKFGVSEPEISRLGSDGDPGRAAERPERPAGDRPDRDHRPALLLRPRGEHRPAAGARASPRTRRPPPTRTRTSTRSPTSTRRSSSPRSGSRECVDNQCTTSGPTYYLFDKQSHELRAGPAERERRPLPQHPEREAAAGHRDPHPCPQGTVVAAAPPSPSLTLSPAEISDSPAVRAHRSPGAERDRDQEPAAELRPDHQPAERHLRLHRHRADGVPGRHPDDRPARQLDRAARDLQLERGRSVLAALRDRARQPGLLEPDHQLRREPGRDRRSHRAPRSRATSTSTRPRTWRPSFRPAPCR